MYNLKDVRKGLEMLSKNSSVEYNAVSDYMHDLENNGKYLEVQRNELKDRLSRRNMQIKDLKEGRDLFEKLYTLAEGSISIENMKHYLIEKEKIIHNNR